MRVGKKEKMDPPPHRTTHHTNTQAAITAVVQEAMTYLDAAPGKEAKRGLITTLRDITGVYVRVCACIFSRAPPRGSIDGLVGGWIN
jgi:hypothetical protein